MSLTVQLVLALTGCRVTYDVKHRKSPPLCASSSIAFSSQSSFVATPKVFISDVVSCVQNYRRSSHFGSTNGGGVSSSSASAETCASKECYIEFFDYTSLKSLLANDVVTENQKLLLFAPLEVTKALSEQLQHCCSKAAAIPTAAIASASRDSSSMCSEEERWCNLRIAIQSLQGLLTLYQDLLDKEMVACTELLRITASRFEAAKEGIYGSLAQLADMKTFYSPETPVTDLINVRSLETSVTKGETRLREATGLLESAQAMSPDLLKDIQAEAQAASDMEASPAWKSHAAPAVVSGGESAIASLMHEVSRKVEEVRRIIKKEKKTMKLLHRCRYYCNAVADHVVHRYEMLRRLPEGMEAAREVVQRRIILRRAVRRLVVPLEEAYRETESSIHDFANQWAQWLPSELFKAIVTPLPPLYPSDDAIAQGMDRLFLDVEEDKTEKLLASIGAAPVESLECQLGEAANELQRCRAALQEATVARAQLEEELRQLRLSMRDDSNRKQD